MSKLDVARMREVAEFWNDGTWITGNAFTSTFDPPAVLALLDRLDAAERKVAGGLAEADALARLAVPKRSDNTAEQRLVGDLIRTAVYRLRTALTDQP